MKPFNLIDDPWIPVHRASHRPDDAPEFIRPAEVVSGVDCNPVVRFAAPRPDFNGALAQFMIGLVQTTMPPRTSQEWREHFDTTPSGEALDARFGVVRAAFNLDGDGPRFMQDFGTELDTEELDAVGPLLIDEPGGQGERLNKDLFVKRARRPHLGRPAAALALFTLQLNAPAGGKGFRTSIRGGGPLTTLLVADATTESAVLWKSIWLNCLVSSDDITGNPLSPRTFSWLAPTRTSSKNEEVSPADFDPVHVYWGMPRRIKLVFEDSAQTCSIYRTLESTTCTGIRTKNYGTNYKGAWHHPLSPYRNDDAGNPIAQHFNGRPSIRDWTSAVFGGKLNEKPATNVAKNIATYYEETGRRRRSELRLWMFGYDMDNMKPVCWYESIFPVIDIGGDTTVKEKLKIHIRCLLAGAELARSTFASSWLAAVFAPHADPKPETSIPTTMFWMRVEPLFFVAIARARDALKDLDTSGLDLRLEWLGTLRRILLGGGDDPGLFDELTTTEEGSHSDLARRARARRDLGRFLGRNAKKVREALDLPELEPDLRAKKSAKGKSRKVEVIQ